MPHTTMKLPLLPNRVYTEQVNVKIDVDTKRKVHALKGKGVDTAELFRESLIVAIDRALHILKADAS